MDNAERYADAILSTAAGRPGPGGPPSRQGGDYTAPTFTSAFLTKRS
jgi:hypothetical protein